MSWTVQDIQNQIAYEVDQDDSSPTAGGTDWTIRLGLINRSLFDWAESYDWSSLKKVHNGLVSTSTANASYALPSDFKKLDGFPRIVSDGVTAYDFPAVDPSRNGQYVDSDKFVNIFPNGRVMYIHAGTLASGASVQFTYYSSPASLATSNTEIICPDPTFIVQRSLYYLYKGREDGRFPEAKVESEKILARMIENENALGLAYVDRSVSVGKPGYKSFRIGRD